MASDEGEQSSTKDQGKQPKSLTAAERLQVFLTESTIHGLPMLHNTKSKRRRTTWLAILFLVLGFICIHLGILSISFASHESNVDFKIVDARRLEFPSVTICNANPIKKSALEELAANSPQLEKLLAIDNPDKPKKRRRRKRSVPLLTWVSYGDTGKEYYLVTIRKKFSDAIKYCLRLKAVLAKIINRTMAEVFLEAFGNKFMTDLNDRDNEGEFKHADGSNPIWAEWANGQPQAKKANTQLDCTAYSKAGLTSAICGYEKWFVCERTRATTVNPTTELLAAVEPTTMYQLPTRSKASVHYESPTTTELPTMSEFQTMSDSPAASELPITTELPAKSNSLTTRESTILPESPTTTELPTMSEFQTLSDSSATIELQTTTELPAKSNSLTILPESPITTELSTLSKSRTKSDSPAASELPITTQLPAKSNSLTIRESTVLSESPTTDVLPTKTHSITISNDLGRSTNVSPFGTNYPNSSWSPTNLSSTFSDQKTTRYLKPEYYSTDSGLDMNTAEEPCRKARCRNGGTCVREGSSYWCICPTQFSGINCELEAFEDGGQSIEFTKSEEVTKILSNLNEEERTRIGFRLEDLLFSCRFSGKMCNYSSDFTQISNPFLGNCYTFNSRVPASTSARYLSTMSGRRYGLEIGINLGLRDMFKAAGGLAGAVVLIHSKDTMPFPEDYGTVITPGVYNTIGVRLVTIKRLPAPYTDCVVADSDAAVKDAYVSVYNVTYSKVGCQKTCLQRHVIEKCQCALPYYPRYGLPFANNKDVSVCDDRNEEDKFCSAKLEMDIAENKLMCDCPDVCQEDVYFATKSACQWPPLKRMKSVIKYLKAEYPKQFPTDNNDPHGEEKVIKQNFMKAAIFYEDLSQEIINEIPVYTAFQFLGDIGGMLGLWVGISALGLVQLAEFLSLTIYTKVKRIYFCTRRVGAMKNG